MIHTWSAPSGIVTHTFDTSIYSNGIYKIKVVGTPDSGPDIIEQTLFNIIDEAEWLLLISEVRWDALNEPDGEFFELYNGFDFDVAIGRWQVSDGEDDFKFLANTNITSKDALVFVNNETVFIEEMGALGITGITPDFLFDKLLLANTGDEIVLTAPNGIVDAVAWGSGSAPSTVSWSGSIDQTKSLQRDPANEDTDDCTVDFIVGTPTPGNVNVTEIPIDTTPPLIIVTPLENDVASGNYQIEISFNRYTYTSGELFINNTLIHTWSDPTGNLTHSVDTTNGYTNGIHNLKVIATLENSTTITLEIEFNIINVDEWLLLITEVRIDAVAEPTGEFFELYNGFTFDVAIGGWELTDGEGSYFVPDGAIFAADDLLVFVRDTAVFTSEMSALGVSVVSPDFIYTHIEFSNTGDDLTLKTATKEIDVVAWGSVSSSVTPWTGTMDDTMSLQRDPANSDTDDCSVDFIADTPNPGLVYITVPPTETSPGYIISISVLSLTLIAIVLRRFKKR